MRNKHAGRCYRCGKMVDAGAGHFERFSGGWRVQHAECAVRWRGASSIIFSDAMVLAILDGRKTQTRRLLKTQGGRFRPGQYLWVREAWNDQNTAEGCIAYRATDKPPPHIGRVKWKSPIHMPQSASRITLAVTSVRVQRLQEISQEDAIAEGAPPSHPSIDLVSREFGYPDFSRSWFAQLWDAIHGTGKWDANPMVEAVTFRVISCATR